ncbi:MAG: transpeptidase family protein [Treponema sp.]|nr:transpeptidase family protein [Treponema sp.]MCI5666580.1 transpeptidase family protein [Spirochaetia bacterium]MDD7768081.1 penicillin-binding protein [Treponema sp.]
MNDFFKRKRIFFCFIIVGLLILITVVSYFNLAIQPITAKAKNIAKVERGAIVDRHGVPLAVQTIFYRIGVNTKEIKDKQDFALKMCSVLDMTEDALFEKIDKKREYVILKKKATMAEYDEIRSLALDCGFKNINYEQLPGRIYPNNSMASQLIGYMGDEGYGLAGIEFSQQQILSPAIDASKENPEQGKNIYLTIDTTLQYKLEQIAYDAITETQAESMIMIAADCKTGEILSYISLPSADLNDYGMASNEAKLNRPSTNAYEPGSVFKIFTVGIVTDEKGISANDSFLCDGAYEKRLGNGETVRIKCLEHHGWLTPREALKYSCNDVLGQISDRISDDQFINRIKQLGFGEKTGIELSGETSGFVKDPDNKTWSARSKPTIAIGQEISVSALQMVQAATAIANGGVPVKLRVISKITDKEGNTVYEAAPEERERAFRKGTADYILSCMETTATTGTGSRANIGDVAIGVKTGTAQMADKENGGYSDTDFLSNCIAIFPVDEPQIILYIVIEKAKGETYAGRIVAPVIGKAADVIIDHMGMSRGKAASVEHNGIINIPRSTTIKLGALMPDFTGFSKKELLPLTNLPEVKININGSGWVTSQNPAPGTPISQGTVIELYLE